MFAVAPVGRRLRMSRVSGTSIRHSRDSRPMASSSWQATLVLDGKRSPIRRLMKLGRMEILIHKGGA